LLLWACALGFSAALAHVTNTAVVGALAAVAPAAALEHADVGSRWVIVSSVDAAGAPRGVVCLTEPGLFSADVVEVSPQDRDRLLAELACRALDSAASDT
jgi:hypothetical protein